MGAPGLLGEFTWSGLRRSRRFQVATNGRDRNRQGWGQSRAGRVRHAGCPWPDDRGTLRSTRTWVDGASLRRGLRRGIMIGPSGRIGMNYRLYYWTGNQGRGGFGCTAGRRVREGGVRKGWLG